MTIAPARPAGAQPHHPTHGAHGPAPVWNAAPGPPGVWDVPAGLALPPAPRGRAVSGPTLLAIAIAAAVLVTSLAAWVLVSLVRAVDDASSTSSGTGTTTAPYDNPYVGTGSTPGSRTTGDAGAGSGTDGIADTIRGGDVTGPRGRTLTAGTMQLTAPKLRTVLYLGTVPTKCSTITYTNTGSDAVWIGPLDWTLRSPSGATLSATYADPATELPSGYLDAGTTTTGDVCFATTEPLAGWDLVYASGHDSRAPSAVFTG